RCVAAIEQGPGPALPMAAVRTLVKRRPDGAVPALLRFLPCAGEDCVEEETLAALVALGLTQGKADPALPPALTDVSPARRAAAAYVLGRARDKGSQDAVRKLLADADPRVRLRAAQGLIAGRHKDAVPALIALLEGAPRDVAWRAEGLLERLAADQSPPFPRDADAEAARKKWREAWAVWWKANAAKIDLAKLEESPRLLGLTIAVAWNVNKVWEVGPDGKTRWEMTAQGPMDAHAVPGNRVLIAEAGSNKVTERDLRGNVVWEKAVDGEPINCGRLPNGNTWIGTRNAILEVTREGKVVYQHKVCDGYLHGVTRLRNGGCVGITNAGKIIELDAAGKEVRSVQLPQEGSWGEVEALPGGKYLVTNYGSGRVFEVDAAGKVVWEHKLSGACGGMRLPNGHTLLACPQRVVEIDRAGKVVWEAAADGFVRRANRR
ncbi:MAG TPA: HEAT repeat domain-containing protein, partial [Gemmataceae bacterium]|nr:HEAT repeat domain-containing protein [Gemmataceae bacterium]